MSYKMIIVDDEEIIRDGLTTIVEWEKMGYEIVAQLENGEEAIEFISHAEVDVVVTDIKMPFASGLDIAEYVYENHPNITVVIISGYRDFEFAKQAIKYNVKHYLVKPTKLDEINEVFSSIKAKLDNERACLNEGLKQAKDYNELVGLVRTETLFGIAMGAVHVNEEMISRLQLLFPCINPLENKIGVIAAYFEWNQMNEDYRYNRVETFTAIRNFFCDDENLLIIPIYNGNNYIYIIVLEKSPSALEGFMKKMNLHNQYIKQEIEALIHIHIDIKILQIFHNLLDMSRGKVLAKTEDKVSDEIMYKRLKEQQRLLITYINAGNIAEVRNLFSGFVEQLSAFDIKTMYKFITDLFLMINEKLNDLGISTSENVSKEFYHNSLMTIRSIESIKVFGQKILDSVIPYFAENKSNNEQNIILKAKEYIKVNFAKDITLEDVAEYVCYSSVYFSKFFKEKTGENFIDYLIKIRIENAMELLKSSKFKIYEVREKIGYSNNKYFINLFKSYTGLTPTEYRSKYYQYN